MSISMTIPSIQPRKPTTMIDRLLSRRITFRVPAIGELGASLIGWSSAVEVVAGRIAMGCTSLSCGVVSAVTVVCSSSTTLRGEYAISDATTAHCHTQNLFSLNNLNQLLFILSFPERFLSRLCPHCSQSNSNANMNLCALRMSILTFFP